MTRKEYTTIVLIRNRKAGEYMNHKSQGYGGRIFMVYIDSYENGVLTGSEIEELIGV